MPEVSSKAKNTLRNLALLSAGFGLSMSLNELIGFPLQGLSVRVDKVGGYIVFNIIVLPLLFLIVRAFIKGSSGIEAKQAIPNGEEKPLRLDATIEDRHWEQASRELNGDRHEATWAKAMASAEGDDSKTKALYIKIRAADLHRGEHLKDLILGGVDNASSSNRVQQSEGFPKYAASDAATSSKDGFTTVTDVTAPSNNKLNVWEAALNEYEGANRDRGLYAKLFVEHDGDDSKVKTAYLKRRAEEISQEQSAAAAKERTIEMASIAKAVNAAIESGSFTEIEVGGRKCLRFIDGYIGFLSLNRYYVFNDVDVLCLQLDAIEKDIGHKVNGPIIVRPLEATTDEVCLKEKRYSQARIGGVNYYLLNNGRVVYFSTGKFYAFEDLALLRNAVQKGDHHKLADSIYGMNLG